MFGRNQQKSQFLPIGVTAPVLLCSNVLLVTMEMKSTSRCIATDIAEYHSYGRHPHDPTSPRGGKRTGKWTWRPERVVRVAVGGDDVAGDSAGGAMGAVALTAGSQTGVPEVGLVEYVGRLDPVG
jgi:hypothetical protein